MQKILSEQTIILKQLEEIPLAAALFEELAQMYDIPSITVDQIRLIVLAILRAINHASPPNHRHNGISLTFKLFDQGSLSIKMIYKGLAFNPFQRSIDHPAYFKDFRIDTFSLHLVRKYMTAWTYHRVLDYNIVYLSKR